MKFRFVLYFIFFGYLLQARTLHVPEQYNTIQKAVNAAYMYNDTIIVSPGDYGTFIINHKNLVIASLYLTTQDELYIDQTVLDGFYYKRVIDINYAGNNTPVKIIGFTVKNGVLDHFELTYGAGLRCYFSNIELSHIKFINNVSYTHGGAAYFFNSSVKINDCEFINNEAPGYYANGQLYDGNGGAIMIECQPQDTIEFNNSSFINSYALKGGAIYAGMMNYTSLIFNDCNFSENESFNMGSAVFANGKTVSFNRCTFSNNTGNNAAINATSDELIIENSLITNNSVAIEKGKGKLIISNSTITDNGCIRKPVYGYYQATIYVYNSILWNICGDEFELSDHTNLYVTYSTIKNGQNSVLLNDSTCRIHWLDNNIDSWPVFNSWDDYHLKPESPCIGAGADSVKMNEQWFYSPVVDLDDSLRPNPTGTSPDIGAYESELGLPVSIHENQVLNTTLYPNPAKNIVYIQNGSGIKNIFFTIIDLSGKTVKEGRVSGNEIRVSDISTGVYLVAINTNRGIIKKKLVINN